MWSASCARSPSRPGFSNPNILPLHDSGSAGGLLYYVMPVVEGGSLRDRLRADAQLPVEESVRLAVEICSALDFAHRQGVVHRDIKPENILPHDERALVADFGAARAVSEVVATALTPASSSLGTPAYMSPEQATSSHDVDGRADLYAVGCVLYEMLGGQQPFAGPTAKSVITQHVAAAIPSARTPGSTIPHALDAVIRRAMAKSRVDRYATDHPSIAVLPFRNLSADPENEYFSEGVMRAMESLTLVRRHGCRIPQGTSRAWLLATTCSAIQDMDAMLPDFAWSDATRTANERHAAHTDERTEPHSNAGQNLFGQERAHRACRTPGRCRRALPRTAH